MSKLIGDLKPAGNISGTANWTKGDKGDKGDVGLTPVFSIGKVEDLDEHSGAEVTITGTPENPVLNFGIPHGWTGEKGDKGDKGDQGVSGVYVGSGEMPEGYNVQIDPTGDATTEKSWVKIETITLPEDVTKIVPSFPANTYTELFVRGSFKYTRTDGKTTGNTAITLGNAEGNLSYIRITNTGTVNTLYYFMCEGKVAADGVPTYELTSSTSQYTGATVARNAYPNGNYQPDEHLPVFSLYISTADVQFAAGSTFEVWGR